MLKTHTNSDYLKLLKEFHNLNCDDPVSSSIACRLYLDLLEVKSLYQVNYKFNETLKEIYFVTKQLNELSPSVIYLSRSSFNDVNLNEIDNIRKTFNQIESIKSNEIILAIIDSSATIIYYKLNEGFKDLDNPMKNFRKEQQQ